MAAPTFQDEKTILFIKIDDYVISRLFVIWLVGSVAML